jgi:isoleucyl-tRNA synthetase
MFEPVSSRINFPQLEMSVLDFWKQRDVINRSMTEREGNPSYVFYEGPPTANGLPGIHHVLSRAFKDLFPRYKTMCGYYCLRRGGWDMHGLPVELKVEKELEIDGDSLVLAVRRR